MKAIPFHSENGRRLSPASFVLLRRTLQITKRLFVAAAVKELSWCSSKDSPNRRREANVIAQEQKEHQQVVEKPIISKFGIIAAMGRTTRIIGIDGKLPSWNIPMDRQKFIEITSNRILIVGKHTLYEVVKEEEDILEEQKQKSTIIPKFKNPQLPSLYNPLRHIDHVRHCIVISKTMTIEQIHQLQESQNQHRRLLKYEQRDDGSVNNSDFLHIARSFQEALQIGYELQQRLHHESTDRNLKDCDSNKLTIIDSKVTDSNNVDANTKKTKNGLPDTKHITLYQGLDCWVAGGERVYEEAIVHRSAKVIHLTLVHDEKKDIKDSSWLNDITDITTVAKFPAKYRWDHKFRLIEQELHVQQKNESRNDHVIGTCDKIVAKKSCLFTYAVYQRLEI